MIYPDVTQWSPVGDGFRRRHGIPGIIARLQEPIRLGRGYRAHDGRFERDEVGAWWLVFPQFRDIVFWQPDENAFATWAGKAFALGEDLIQDASTCALGHHLNIYSDTWTWLRSGCDGVVVTDWGQAFDRLRDVPRVAVDASILTTYQKSMVPKRLPRVFVIETSRAAA